MQDYTSPKVIAFYLPQYHVIPENEKWWGSGFTEWSNVKTARSFFKDHYQPKVPLMGHYVLNDDTRTQQEELAKSYGIYGFCYYHYWFNGKTLLEKPVENMLRSRNRFPFCLCWANENWTRKWDGMNNEILQEQDYGSWDEHFQYLLPFFKDSRSIKLNGKPIFLVYRVDDIPEFSKMTDHWQDLAKQNGLHGIYFISVLTAWSKVPMECNVDAVCEFTPFCYKDLFLDNDVRISNAIPSYWSGGIFDYEKVCEKILSSKDIHPVQFKGVFPQWDNTARRGNRAVVFYGSTPDKYYYFLSRQLERSKELLFINAWNEWGEGCYLEPDEYWGFDYLNKTKDGILRIRR